MKSLQAVFTAYLARLRLFCQRVQAFFLHDVWLVDTSVTPRAVKLAVYQLQVVLIVLRGFFVEHQCLLRASALTYTTMLALVPMLAFMFAFLKGLGVQHRLEPLLIDKLSVGSEETVRLIIGYVNKVEVSTLGIIGLGGLLFSTLLQLGTVEHALNEIWGVRQSRTLARKVADYISVMVIAPVLLLLTITVSAALKNQTLVTTLLDRRVIGDAMVLVFTLLPYVAMWGAFTFFYTFIPNTRVKLLPALIGGVIAGTLWQLAQWAYIEFQIGMANYQAIYGAFAQLPVLMVWLYTSWAITLLGAEVSFACQNAAASSLERFASLASFSVKEWLASALYFSLAQAYMEGKGPWSAVAFAQQHRIPIRLLRELLHSLLAARLVVEDATVPEHYVPGRDPATITPWHILHVLRHQGTQELEDVHGRYEPRVATLMTQVEEAERRVAGARSITQWLTEKDPADAKPEGRA
jgi:membrane protein